jgi:hypothetical protein
LGQASAKNLSRHVLEFSPLLHGTHFHGAQEIIRDVEGRFHIDKFPAFQLSVKLLLCPPSLGSVGRAIKQAFNPLFPFPERLISLLSAL